MPINALLTQIQPDSLKDQIISTIAEGKELTAKEIYSRITKSKNVSYQAIHKTLKEMEKMKILEKNEKKYLINKEWIDNSIKTLTQIKATYIDKTKKLKIDKDTDKPQVFKFTSYSALCVSIAELLRDRILAKKEDTNYACTLEYGWFPFKFKFTDFFTLMEMVKNNPTCINIVRTTTPLGKWIHKQYLQINAPSAPIGTKVDIDEDLFVYGEYLIEVRFSEESKKIIEYYYNKLNNIEDVFKEFALKKEPEMDITVTITKNKQLADYLNKKLLDAYNKAMKKAPNR